MKLMKSAAAIALIVSNISAIQLNIANESVALQPGTALTHMKDGVGTMKNNTKAANSTVQDNGTLTQEGNTTFSHTLAEANDTIIDNHTSMIQLMDNASDASNATQDAATFVQIGDNASVANGSVAQQ